MLISLLLVSLSGCVTYYYPETALEDGVYYAADDPSYVLNSGDYTGVVYYPWSSLDYFYLGYWPYPGYGFVYGYPYGWGYSPWDYPIGYYGYYPPRYFSRHHHGYWWYLDGNHHDRYAREGRGHRRNHDSGADQAEEFTREEDSDLGRNSATSVTRYVMTPPFPYAGNQGMVIRNSGNSKSGKSRVGPTQPTTTKPVSISPSNAGGYSQPPASASLNTYSNRPARMLSPPSRQSTGNSNKSRRRDRD